MIAKGIFSILSGDSTLTAIVGTRIYPVIAPQSETLPDNYIVFKEIANNPRDTKSGVSELDTIRLQIESWSDKHDEMETIDQRIRDLLDRYTGTANTVNFDSFQFLTFSQMYDWEVEKFVKASDYNVRVHR